MFFNILFCSYIPVYSKDEEEFDQVLPPRKFHIGDGSLYDNSGVLPLIQRGMKKIIFFLHSNTKLIFRKSFGTTKNGKTINNGEEISCKDPTLLGLFGANQTHSHINSFNQIFETKDLDYVLEDFAHGVKNGSTPFSRRQFVLIENKNWNIEGGTSVEMVFIYNNWCDDFINQLPNEIKKKKGIFKDFPFYKKKDASKPFSLNKTQVSLLAAQAEYNLKQSMNSFKTWLNKN